MRFSLTPKNVFRYHPEHKTHFYHIPYITHPLALAVIPAQAACSEEVIVAGILHDTLEDTAITVQDIKREFGPHVAEIVLGASEPYREKACEEHKAHTAKYLWEEAPWEVLLVACADKLHNIRSIGQDYREKGEAVWGRFKRGRYSQAVYYRALANNLFKHDDNSGYEPLFETFARAMERVFPP